MNLAPSSCDTSPVLTLLVREGCHLCEDMAAQLHELLPKDSFRLERVDIDLDPGLREQHNVRVPVLMLAGEELCHHFLDLQAVREGLAGYTGSNVRAD